MKEAPSVQVIKSNTQASQESPNVIKTLKNSMNVYERYKLSFNKASYNRNSKYDDYVESKSIDS